jgi:ABC-type branched-subunit amino acid transport system substrate-binding protein
VLLGGTCGKNNWRNSFIESLVQRGVKRDLLLNPVVDDWNQEAQIREDEAKRTASFMLYYLADPQDENKISAYSMVEAVMALYDDPERTVVVFDTTNMTGHALKAMNKVQKDLIKLNAK